MVSLETFTFLHHKNVAGWKYLLLSLMLSYLLHLNKHKSRHLQLLNFPSVDAYILSSKLCLGDKILGKTLSLLREF